MKKFLKIIGLLLAAVVLLVIIGVIYIQASGIPKYDVAEVDFQASMTPHAVERGEKLTKSLCANCHKNAQTQKLTGAEMLDAPKEFGFVYAPNITQNKEYGIGNYSDGELVHLLRTGIKRDGTYAPPYMAKLPHMADSDIDAIISFLKSGHSMVAADPTPDKPCRPSLLTKFLCRVAFKPLPLPKGPISLPDTNDRLAVGEYLSNNFECYACHSADFKSMNVMEPEKSVGFFGGGNPVLDKQGRVVPSLNITPDPETGIGNWTEEEFIQAVRFGVRKGEPALRYPMMPYTELTEDEISAIYAYLKTVPPIVNNVERIFYDE